LIAFLILIPCFAQKEIPEYPGDEGTGQHAGQPQWCQAHDENGHKKNCGICDMKCERGQEAEEKPTCKTYCRKGACRCSISCMPTGKFMKRNPPQAVDVVFRLDNQFAVKAMFKAMLTPKKGI
jgi:hypothetical protein